MHDIDSGLGFMIFMIQLNDAMQSQQANPIAKIDVVVGSKKPPTTLEFQRN